jgi:hypothetical protein
MPETKAARGERYQHLIARRNAGKGGRKTDAQARGGKTRNRTAGRRSGSRSNAS